MSAAELRFRAVWLTVGWLLIVTIIYFSLARVEVDLSDGRDKWSHLLAYGSLMFWFGGLYCGLRSQFCTASAFVGLGILLEFLQGMTGYRSFDLADVVANSLGIGLGWVLIYTPLRRLIALMDRGLTVAFLRQ